MKKLIILISIFTSLTAVSQGIRELGSNSGTLMMKGARWYMPQVGSVFGLPIGNAGSRPLSPNQGDTYYDSDSLALMTFSGTVWKAGSGGGGGGLSGGITGRFPYYAGTNAIIPGTINDSAGSVNVYKNSFFCNDGTDFNHQWLQGTHNASSHDVALNIMDPTTGSGFAITYQASTHQRGFASTGTAGLLNITGWNGINVTTGGVDVTINSQVNTKGDNAGIYYELRDAPGSGFIGFATANQWRLYTPAGTQPFKITTGAPNNSFLMASSGAIGLGGTPDASAVLDMQSTTGGLLLPRLTTTQRGAISSPGTSLIIFNTSTGTFQYYTGSTWQDLGGISLSTAQSVIHDSLDAFRNSLESIQVKEFTTTDASTINVDTIPIVPGEHIRVECILDGARDDGHVSVGAKRSRSFFMDDASSIHNGTLISSEPESYLPSGSGLSTASFTITSSGSYVIIQFTGEASTTILGKITSTVTRKAVPL